MFRIVKLRCELNINPWLVKKVYRILYKDLLFNISMYSRRTKYKYPISVGKLLCAFTLYKNSQYFVIGIDPNNTILSKDEYKKILSVEYGYYGLEIRLLRKTLEEGYIKIKNMLGE